MSRALGMLIALVLVLTSFTFVTASHSNKNVDLQAGETLHVECPTELIVGTTTATSLEAECDEAPVQDLTGQVCPQAIHDSYTAVGPDGLSYPTWHPVVDPATNCHFGHEHGNDPASVVSGYSPVFGYVGEVTGMVESHHGFKVYAFEDHLTGLDWVITQHQGTTTRNALCGRFHAIEIAVFDNGTMEANLHFMADFGRSRFHNTSTYMTPPECPNQGDIDTQGLRRLPITGDGYTPYIVNQTIAELGLRLNAGFLTTDGRTSCPDATCAQLSTNEDNTGSRRRFQVLQNGLSINQTVTTSNSGTFTDSAGVIQFIDQGFTADLLVAKHNRDSKNRGGMWYFDGVFGPMHSPVDGYTFNGAEPLMPVSQFDTAN